MQMHCFDYLGPRNEMTDFDGERIRAIMHLDPVIVSLFDPVRSIALYWTRDVARIPVWDWGTPLRIILNEWAKLHGLFLVHSGAVGIAEGGVIFAGKSGSGKSTSALACLDDGDLLYAGDDYSLVSVTAGPVVHSLYSSAKLKGAADFERFAHLLPLVANRDHLDSTEGPRLPERRFRREGHGGLSSARHPGAADHRQARDHDRAVQPHRCAQGAGAEHAAAVAGRRESDHGAVLRPRSAGAGVHLERRDPDVRHCAERGGVAETVVSRR